MLCPNCNTVFKPVKIDSLNKGYVFQIEQCPNCGGLWFDQYELYQTPLHEALAIDSVQKDALERSVPIKETLFCPNDQSPLVAIDEPLLPKKVDLKRCNKCGGIWLNKGELAEFKQELAQKPKALDPDTQKMVNDMLPSSQFGNAVSSVAGFLMTPINPMTGHIENPEAQVEPYKLSDAQVELLKGLPANQKVSIYNHLVQENRAEENRSTMLATGVVMGIMAILRVIMGLITGGII